MPLAQQSRGVRELEVTVPKNTRTMWRVSVLAAATLAMTATATIDVEAQRRRAGPRIGPRGGRTTVRVVRPIYRPYYGFGYQYGAYPYGYYSPSYYYPAYDPTTAVRIQVKPEATEVYVDGYFAGVVDDFDGFFQRLRLPPGEYEIALRLDGHRAVSEWLRLTHGSTVKVRHVMVPLEPGESQPPPPEPVEPIDPTAYGTAQLPEAGDPRVSTDPRLAPAAPAPRTSRPLRAESTFGAIAVRAQPSDAEVLIDGERWQGPTGSERLTVEVGAGVHVVEVHKPGYEPYMAEIEVLPGETLNLNVSLPRLPVRGV
ncbi:MAG: hypothetical protein CL476_00650 [Acidobacteria bacterium]|jgi:hypothetical protein|nr:hypothetical protein [Acidobacteriota bacterium]|tara:strand:+ start:906 stop:1844 length:939 start_codon:yes stop_codon:yes gene_type:complete